MELRQGCSSLMWGLELEEDAHHSIDFARVTLSGCIFLSEVIYSILYLIINNILSCVEEKCTGRDAALELTQYL